MTARKIFPAMLVLYAWLFLVSTCHGFSASSSFSSPAPSKSPHLERSDGFTDLDNNNILILDHLNINHEKGRHDWLHAFYKDFLHCAWDPRKEENRQSGKKTIWANIGAHQFHLPEGKSDAQVLEGVVTLVYPSIQALKDRYASDDNGFRNKLKGSRFELQEDGNDALLMIDPWGSFYRLVEGPVDERDGRGRQPGEESEGLSMRDLTIYVPLDANLPGIGRFYGQILGTNVAQLDDTKVQISMGPLQTLTFVCKEGAHVDSHVDLRDEELDEKDHRMPEGCRSFPGNYGIHISLYVLNLPRSYRNAEALGVAYVNTRFSRRAYTLEQAVDDCMFRILTIIDPENADAGPIIHLEHEVRSVIKRDGSKYKSCPFDSVPEGCVTLAL